MDPAMRWPWHVVVVIPARDEASNIERCVRSVRRAIRLAMLAATSDIVVVADSCSDDTADRARQALGRAGAVIEAEAGSAGAARRAGVDLGLARASSPAARTWIANTDADSTVPAAWITGQLRSAAGGVHAVAGVVRLARGSERTRALQRAFTATYRHDPAGTHGHVHGANLGIRADAYLAAGGWSDMVIGEDHDLWRRVRRNHVGLCTTASYVRTSARRIGRAPYGFAADLAALDTTIGI
jgi:glycosyltransferase involved in cell wall biosynthesis